MTTAVCIYCGELKFGAFVPCNECGRIPQDKQDVVSSLALTDHYYSMEELKAFGAMVKLGEELQIEETFKQELEGQVSQDSLDLIKKLADPEYRERCRRREERIIVALIGVLLLLIAWMVYRFLTT